LDGPLPKLCPVIPTSNQDGRQAKIRKKGDEILKKSSLKLLSQSQPNLNLNKVVANFEKHTFLSQTDLTRTGIISNSYNEMFEA
jgi:hypothetical protein